MKYLGGDWKKCTFHCTIFADQFTILYRSNIKILSDFRYFENVPQLLKEFAVIWYSGFWLVTIFFSQKKKKICIGPVFAIVPYSVHADFTNFKEFHSLKKTLPILFEKASD